ncbi:C-C motif chemokine 4-like [Pungitius pungitius]|uniref:C-C motif chemokine 4-like n=1 Tax=Pungitius pungitius TaxID=134920 RepID=UPI002E14D16C
MTGRTPLTEEHHHLYPEHTMRTLSCTVGLLLCFYCCTAMPRAVNMSPGLCCFHFFTQRVPSKQIVSIIETDNDCPQKAFVVRTAKGREICVGPNVNWAQEAFERKQVTGD